MQRLVFGDWPSDTFAGRSATAPPWRVAIRQRAPSSLEVTMRIWITVVALAALQDVALRAQCDANPRWLLVTVTDVSYVNFRTTERTDVDVLNRQQMIDRCEVDKVDEQSTSQSAVLTITAAGTPVPDSFTLLFVDETPQEICAAVRDCADATKR